MKYHYLSNISRGFKSGINFALKKDSEVRGVCIFTKWPVPELLVGCFGLKRDDQDGFWELSRLVLNPEDQSIEHNLASWFVSRSIRRLKKDNLCRAILSYADDDFHNGTVYAACNFEYFGLTDKKCDFWIKSADGKFTKHSRGRVKDLCGEWRPRSRKHRFLMVFDSELNCKWSKQKWKAKSQPCDLNEDITNG